MLLTQQMYSQGDQNEETQDTPMNMTYYSDLLREAVNNYKKSQEEVTEGPHVGEEHKSAFIHPYDILMDNQTDDELAT